MKEFGNSSIAQDISSYPFILSKDLSLYSLHRGMMFSLNKPQNDLSVIE